MSVLFYIFNSGKAALDFNEEVDSFGCVEIGSEKPICLQASPTNIQIGLAISVT